MVRLDTVVLVAAVVGLAVSGVAGAIDAAWAPGLAAFGFILLAWFVARAPAAREAPEVPARRHADLPAGFGRMILERVPTPLLVISDKGRIIYANTAAMQLLPSILIGDHFASLVRAPVFVQAVKDTLADGAAREVEFMLPGRDRRFAAQASRLPAGSEFGDARQAIVRIEDVTQAHLLAEMRADFIANASHELRTPLASLLGYIETLREHGRDDPEAQERFLDIMDKQARRMQRLVDDLMSLSRIEMSAGEPPGDRAALNALAAEAVAAIRPLAEKAGKTLIAGFDDMDGPVIACDRDQVLQVMGNLIDNAIRYGGQTITVSEAAPDPARKGMVGVSVADDGQGIDRRDLHRLTERFFRVSVAKSRAAGGTGLGLAIVKHILNRHSADLAIWSEPGRGARFTAWFPVADGSEDAPEQAAGDSEIRRKAS